MVAEELVNNIEDSPKEEAFQLSPVSKHISALLLVVLLLFSFQWFSHNETLRIPSEVKESRKEFSIALSKFEKNRRYWLAKADQSHGVLADLILQKKYQEMIDSLNDISSETFVALLDKHNFLEPLKHSKGAVMPKGGTQTFPFIISKKEKDTWPLNIIVSLEAELKIYQGQMIIEFVRLRRGTKELSLDLSLAYFGPEVSILQKLDPCFQIPAIGTIRQT